LIPLSRRPRPAHKIEVIKFFYSWLVKEKKILKASEDPTFRVLTVPQAKSAQWGKSKVIPLEHYLLVRDLLTGPWREALIMLAGTGWHVSELCRFAEGAAIEPLPKSMMVEDGPVCVLVCPRHESGDMHRTAVNKAVLDAASSLRARGHFARDGFEKSITAACKAVKCPDGTVGIQSSSRPGSGTRSRAGLPRRCRPERGERVPGSQVGGDHQALLCDAGGGSKGADVGMSRTAPHTAGLNALR
jgi:hypothetical protein